MVHEYRHGYQHVLNKSEIYMKNVHGTMVVWLQNENGQNRWGPSESRVEALLEAFRPVREKEREKSQQDLANAAIINQTADPVVVAGALPSISEPKPPSTNSTVTSTATVK